MPHSRWHSSVKPLVEFCCRRGNLGYTEAPAARAEQGQMAQRRVQTNTPPGYRKEVPVDVTLSHHGITLTLSGRIDGLWEDDGALVLEEIKSTYFHNDTLPEPLFQVHQAQALCYVAMLPEAQRYPSVRVRVTYFQLKDEVCFYRESTFSLASIHVLFQQWTSDYCAWLALIAQHRQQRDAWAAALNFPFEHYRRGQRMLAVTAWRYARDKKVALLEAPTGAGKTISFLFPALKRFSEDPALRLFYLTAKTSGQRAVQQTLQRFPAGQELLSVYLTAKTQLCPCLKSATTERMSTTNALQCERCIGYYDRRRNALESALSQGHLDNTTLTSISDDFQVCPHQLALDLCPWADLVVGDFNYLFDPFTRQSLDDAFDEHSVLLIDEAHNLPERARSMFTCNLTAEQLDALLAMKPPADVRKPVRALLKQLQTPLSAEDKNPAHNDVPASLANTLQSALESLRTWMDDTQAPLIAAATTSQIDPRFETWMGMFALQRAFEHWGDHYCLMYAEPQEPAQVTAYCLDPGVFLVERWLQSAGALLFSGTLQPAHWYSQSLGLQRLPTERRGDDIAIEHALENTEVRAALLALPMQYHARLQSLPVAVTHIVALLKTKPGRYLIAAASFEILGQLQGALIDHLPAYRWSIQTSDSSANERQHFLTSFVEAEHSAALVITGGVFAEGIDLADTPLQGVVQVGLPIPPPSEERKRLQHYHQVHFNQGFEYTYSFPAIARTLQTCGRLLRKDGDNGCLLLIDARFLRSPYSDFLPSHWCTQRVRNTTELIEFISAASAP